MLFIHDIHHAAVFGRPPHIHSQYSDVPALTVSDMLSHDPENAVPQESDLFATEFCRLAVLLDQCLQDKYCAASGHQQQSKAWLALKKFPSTLPEDYKRSVATMTPRHGFYPAVLELVHLDYLIVVERMLSSGLTPGTSGALESYFKSAGAICRVLEDLSASPSSLVARLPFVAFPAVYCSISIHIMYLRREPGGVRLVAEHRARFGMAVSNELQNRWPFAVWTHYLLDRMLKNAGSTLPPLTGGSSHAEQQLTSVTEGREPAEQMSQTALSSFEYHSLPGLAKETEVTPLLPETVTDTRTEGSGFTVEPDGTFSPFSFMFPWNSFMDDGMEIDQWLL